MGYDQGQRSFLFGEWSSRKLFRVQAHHPKLIKFMDLLSLSVTFLLWCPPTPTSPKRLICY